MTSTILFYDVVLFVHVLAVVLAFGVTFSCPLPDAHMRGPTPETSQRCSACRSAMFGSLAGLLIIAAIFVMTVKPGA